jgi:ketosteroid isomerase-like protein
MKCHRSLFAVALGFGIGGVSSLGVWAETDRPVHFQLNVGTRLAETNLPQAASANEKDAIHKVISDYYDAVPRSSAAAAAFYGEPALLVLPNAISIFNKQADVEAFLANGLATLKPLGYAYSKVIDPRVKLLNSSTAIYSAIAARYKADGAEMQRAGFTYLLRKDSSGWKIHELIATDLDKLLSAE